MEKLCADCRHIVTDQPEGVMCGRTKLFNSITGEPFWRPCVIERQDSWRSRFFSGGKCGSAGIHWEPKQERAVEFRWGTPPQGDFDWEAPENRDLHSRFISEDGKRSVERNPRTHD